MLKKKRVKSHNLKGKKINHAFRFMVLLIIEILAYYMCGLFKNPQDIMRYGTADYLKYIKHVLGHPFGNYLTAFTAIVMPVIFVVWMIQYADALDKANKKYMHGKEMGSARWEDVEAFNKRFKCEKENENMILTKNARKMYDKKTLLNNNVTVVGGSGAGKTAGFVAPNLLQFYGTNIYVDPKGDTLADFGPALVKEGIPIKVLNLCSMLESHQYNPFRYITEELQIDQLINNIVANTNPKDAKSAADPFWEKAEILCEKALFFYVWLECPQPYYKYTQAALGEFSEEIEAGGQTLYKTPILDKEGKQKVLTQTMRSFLLLLGEAEVKERDYELSDLDCRMLALQEKLQRQGKLPEQHKALDHYNRVMRGAKDTVRSIVISANARFSAFNTEKVLRIFDDDELELETVGIKKQALFLIIPDDDSTYNFAVGMLYTQLFQTLYRVARSHKNKLPIPVGFWMDEFANIKMPNDFEKILSTCRSRNIYIVIILQSLAQLKTLYPNDAHEGILGNCDTFVYLGGNEKSSQKYVSETLGKWTIDKRTNNQTLGKQGSVSVNNDILGRELMTEDEVSMLGNHECIVKVRGVYPIRDDKCYWFQNPEYSYVNDLPTYHSDVLVRQEKDGSIVTVKYKSPYKFLTEEELKEMKKNEEINILELHPADLLMLDIIEEKIKEEEWKEFEERGIQLYEEINLEEMDQEIECQQKDLKEKSEQEGLSNLLEKYSYSDGQMEVILEALQEDMSMDDIARFAQPERSVKQMRYMKDLLRKIS